ncbi:MAG: acetoacetate metabolism transcriptional regulator AtoC [Salibacteraceae bacterium]
MADTTLFVVEDNEWYNRLLKHNLELDPEHEVHTFTNGQGMLEALEKLRPDIITLDYRLPDVSADQLIPEIKKRSPKSAIVIISEQDDIGTAVGLLKQGADDYLEKSKDLRDRLLHTIAGLKKHRHLEQRVEQLEEEVSKKYVYSELLAGESEKLQEVFKLINKAVKTNINVMVTGETGTGKELVSKAIHYNSAQAKGPFVALNVAAIPDELIESELFGHEKGAFTGAHQLRKGKFEEASKGTLLLDEIGEMDLNMQSKLLRVLQEREFCRVGSNKPIPLQCRVIVATHRNLADMVKNGTFREDLYYRLYGITINLPPLRERGSDIIILAEKFIAEFAQAHGLSEKKLTPQARKKLLQYDFPGNVRELKSVVELAATLSEGNTIEEDDIQFPQLSLENKLFGTERTMREYQHLILMHYMKKYNDDVSLVAKKLDLGKSTIYRMLKE